MANSDYLVNGDTDLTIARGSSLTTEQIVRAVNHAHGVISRFADFEVDVFALLGMRNLSSFIGEIFAASLAKTTDGLLKKNPHQDGYPDLLHLDEVGRKHWATVSSQLRDKEPFSPFKTGGVEVKATCGSVPTPAQCAKLRTEKPDIGDQRVNLLRGYDWKAHHRETNHLIGLVWDFIEHQPRVVGVFYSNKLTTDDWGKIVQPKEGGGRTTSVSIMTRDGVKKMCRSWVLLLNDKRYIRFFSNYNQLDLTRQVEAPFLRKSG